MGDGQGVVERVAGYGCKALKTLTLPLRLEQIGDAVFDNSKAIRDVIFRGPSPVEGSSSMFESEVYENATLYVRKGRELLFMTVSPWKFFFNIADEEYTPDVKATSIAFDVQEVSASVGDKFNLIATVLPENTKNKSIAWSSSDGAVATVDDTGLVEVIGEGSCIITAPELWSLYYSAGKSRKKG